MGLPKHTETMPLHPIAWSSFPTHSASRFASAKEDTSDDNNDDEDSSNKVTETDTEISSLYVFQESASDNTVSLRV